MKYLIAVITAVSLSACSTISTEPPSKAGKGDIANSPGSEDIEATTENRLPHVIYFSNNSAELEDKAKSVIENHAAYLAEKADIKVSLQGAASTLGDAEYNYTLGLERAEAIKNALIEYGISPKRIVTSSIGDTGSALRETTIADSKRRVVIAY